MTRRWRAENRETVAKYNRQYVKGHLDYFVQAEHKRNALKRQLPHTLTLQEWEEIKAEFKQGVRAKRLEGQVLGMIFEKMSLRTRVSFEAGMSHLGGSSMLL